MILVLLGWRKVFFSGWEEFQIFVEIFTPAVIHPLSFKYTSSLYIFGGKSLLNFNCTTMILHNCHYTILHTVSAQIEGHSRLERHVGQIQIQRHLEILGN